METCPFWVESTGHLWILHSKDQWTGNFNVIPDVSMNKLSKRQSSFRWFETPWPDDAHVFPSIYGCYRHKHVWRAGTSNYIPQILWDVITCPCPPYLLVVQHSWIVLKMKLFEVYIAVYSCRCPVSIHYFPQNRYTIFILWLYRISLFKVKNKNVLSVYTYLSKLWIAGHNFAYAMKAVVTFANLCPDYIISFM